VSGGQKVYKALKYAPFPVVSAPSGMALGGGCEILLHSDHVQAHAETYTADLVEVGVGLIPGWGGCKEMILRYQQEEREAYDKATGGKKLWFSPKNTPMGAVRKAFETIAMAKVAKSAQEAKELRYLKKTDGITMNRDRLLFDAKQKAIELAKDYKAPEMVEEIRLPGASGKMALDMAVADLRKSGKATPYDVTGVRGRGQGIFPAGTRPIGPSLSVRRRSVQAGTGGVHEAGAERRHAACPR
jgi:3-hydroxyacyl-CoA dehydrogenase